MEIWHPVGLDFEASLTKKGEGAASGGDSVASLVFFEDLII